MKSKRIFRLGQKGYIGLALIVFLIVLSALIFPFKFPPSEGSGCRVGKPGDENIIFLPPIKNVGAARGGAGGVDESAEPVEYVRIRQNVPIFMNSTDPSYVLGYPDWNGRDGELPEGMKLRWPVIADVDYLGRHADIRHTNIYREANQVGYDVYYPMGYGEIELPFRTRDRAGVDMTITDPNQSILTLSTEGFLIFVHLGPDGEPIKLNYGQHIYYLVDFYQDKRMYKTPIPLKGYDIEDAFHCLDPDSPANSEVVVPDQETSSFKDQLQLEWFVLKGQPGMYAHCKPAIYLYPTEKQLVNVKVYPKGELTYTDPPYDSIRGWTVWAEPDGNLSNYDSGIMNHGKAQYDYLYYESKILDSEIEKPVRGWSVKKDEMRGLFNRVLPRLGLNPREQKDFSDYWLKQLPDSPYYFVGLIERDQRDYLETLKVIPAPETSIRFSFYFELLDRSIAVEEPQIQTPERNGFTLVDWGGMIKLHKDTPFTCSQ